MIQNQRDQRRFPRVRLHGGMSEALPALSAQVAWPNLETSKVIDLSYKGVAVQRPGLYPLAVEQIIPLELSLGGLRPFRAKGRVAWANQDNIGIEIAELPPDGHLTMNAFLRAKLVGSQLQQVSKVYFGPQHSFDYWYQGPDDTHVFVWLNSVGFIKKVRVQKDGLVVDMARGDRLNRLTDAEFQALLLLSQMDNTQLPMEEFLRCLRGD